MLFGGKKDDGSPPRMRGKLMILTVTNARLRITPADAGKTLRWSFGSRPPQDHPRGCGENSPFAVATRFLTGSPPRMRGKQVDILDGAGDNRITPADAGKTRANQEPLCVNWDHPRGCGENAHGLAARLRTHGSPPRMRGKLTMDMLLQQRVRITPADAGKTISS